MIASSALESDCRLLGRQCIIGPSSESRGRVAGWSLWRFMAPSQALIASFSLGSLGRPTESCDQRGACRGWGGGVGSYRWVWPKYRPLKPVTETNGVRERSPNRWPTKTETKAERRRLATAAGRDFNLAFTEKERRIMSAPAEPLTIYCWEDAAVRERNIRSHSIHFIMTSPKQEITFWSYFIVFFFLLLLNTCLV